MCAEEYIQYHLMMFHALLYYVYIRVCLCFVFWDGVLVQAVRQCMFTLACKWVGGCNRVCVNVWVWTHSMRVGAVGAAVCAEWQSHSRVEDAKLADHLLHAADGPLLISVGELHYQTGGCSLRHRKRQKY